MAIHHYTLFSLSSNLSHIEAFWSKSINFSINIFEPGYRTVYTSAMMTAYICSAYITDSATKTCVSLNYCNSYGDLNSWQGINF